MKLKINISVTLLAILSLSFSANAQNWQYVGASYLSGSTTSSAYLYFGDMEIDSSGNVLVGYWEYNGKLSCAKFDGTNWTQLPSPGTFPSSSVDIETHGTDYYMAYWAVRGADYYGFVRKYDGSSWPIIGDSILIGGVGQGASFDFLLDNNGVPTIVGIQKAAFGNKTVKQFSGGSWNITYEIPNSTSSIYKDGSAMFDAANKLFCGLGGVNILNVAPYIQYYTLGLKIDGNSSSIVGDTIFSGSGTNQFKIDSTGQAYLLFNNVAQSTFFAYKLNGSTWTVISDTAGAIGGMQNEDISNDGKVVFNASTINNLEKSIFQYGNNSRSRMDSLNIEGQIVSAVSDIKVYHGYVYALILEIKTGIISGYSVMRHKLSEGETGINETNSTNTSFLIYPNPTTGKFVIDSQLSSGEISVYNLLGEKILQQDMSTTIDLSNSPRGVYFVKIDNGEHRCMQKVVVQ